jgi:hypothetical protein
MNIINSVIIFATIMLSIFLVLNTTTTTPMMINVFAEPKEEYEKEERSYGYQPEKEDRYTPIMNDSYSQGLLIVEEYNPDRYGGYYGHYEGEFYLDQYDDGNPYEMR